MSDRQRLGAAGEDAALAFLSAQGWRLLARHVRSRYGEIDLVGREAGQLVFVEVKTRASLWCGTPEEAFTQRKRRRLWQTAASFLSGEGSEPVRFDLIAVRVGECELSVKRYRNVMGRWA